MVKFILYITKFVITAAIALLFASCNYNVDFGGQSVKGDGNVVTENRNNDNEFKSIEVSRALEVEIEQSNERSITVVADRNLQNHISTHVENGVLKITADANIKEASSKKVIVKMQRIEALQASSAAKITSKNTIRSNDLSLSASSASEIEIAYEGESLSAESTSAANIRLSGKSLRFESNSSSGSTINAEKLLANDITAEASSGSGIDIFPLANLNARASSGAHISYHNRPKNNLEKKSSSGGSINQE